MKDVVCALWTLVVCLHSSLLIIFLCMIYQTANQSDVSHRQAPPLIQHAQSAQKPTSTVRVTKGPRRLNIGRRSGRHGLKSHFLSVLRVVWKTL